MQKLGDSVTKAAPVVRRLSIAARRSRRASHARMAVALAGASTLADLHGTGRRSALLECAYTWAHCLVKIARLHRWAAMGRELSLKAVAERWEPRRLQSGCAPGS